MQLEGKNPDSAFLTQQDVLNTSAKQHDLNFKLGTAFRDENTSYALMATLVQRVAGQSLRELASQKIFVPLGMNHTQYRDKQAVPQSSALRLCRPPLRRQSRTPQMFFQNPTLAF